MIERALVNEEDFERQYSLLRETCARFEPQDVGLLVFEGEDRRAWLQGQSTNDLRGLEPGGSKAFCFLSPTGQILANCEIWAVGEAYVLQAPFKAMPQIVQRCEDMIIMEDVQYRDASTDYRLISIQGPAATLELGQLVELPTLDAGQAQLNGEDVFCLRSNRTGYGGWDLLLPRDASGVCEALERAFEPVSGEVVDVARLEAGIPVFGRDIGSKTLPPELGKAFDQRNVSYRKGCYTGQEVLMRIHARGHTNKTWMGLITDERVTEGEVVRHMGKDVGQVTSAGVSPRFGDIAAAYVKNEAAFDGEEVTIGDGDVRGEVREMPLLRFD